MGTFKDSWPIWVLVIGGIIIFALAFNQKQTPVDVVSVEEIFPDETEPEIDAAPHQSGLPVPPIVEPLPGPVEPEPVVAAPAPAGQYAVQVASFKDMSHAQKALSGIEAKGFSGRVVTADLGEKGIYYRVRLGSFASKAEAEEMLKKVQAAGLQGLVVKEN